MRLLTQPDANCLVYSFCMITEIDPERVFEHMGHRGQEIWWPPDGMRGIHFQELLDFALDNDWCITIIDRQPESIHERFRDQPREVPSGLFENALIYNQGILVGFRVNKCHAWAWDSTNRWLYDPNGQIIKDGCEKIYESCHLFLPVLRIKSF